MAIVPVEATTLKGRVGKCYSLTRGSVHVVELMAWKGGKTPSRFLDALIQDFRERNAGEVTGALEARKMVQG